MGHCAWNELATSDPNAVLAFYAEQFGWSKDSEMDMGPMGTYHLVRHCSLIGGIMRKPDQMPVSMWTFYFRVPDIDVAAEAAVSGGGSVIHGPIEIPGGEYALNVIDPQGAPSALVGPRN